MSIQHNIIIIHIILSLHTDGRLLIYILKDSSPKIDTFETPSVYALKRDSVLFTCINQTALHCSDHTVLR